MRSVLMVKLDTGMREPVVTNDEAIPSLTAGTVLIKVKACILGAPDFEVLQELGISQQRIPVGREVAGYVEEVGSAVTRFQKGDEVVGILPLDVTCSGCAEYCTINEYELVKKPKEVTFADAAACIGDAVRSYTALHYQGRICAGETVLVTSMKGSGMIAVQLAHYWGAKVIAVGRTQEELSQLESLKSVVAHIVEIEGQKKFAILNECLEETGGLGVDCIIDNGVNMFPNDDVIGPPNLARSSSYPTKHELISCLAVGGRWVTSQNNLQLDPPDSKLMFLKGASVHFLNPDVWGLSASQQGRYLHIMQDSVKKVAAGVLKPVISQRITLDQVPLWYQRLNKDQLLGKMVVEI